jgi:FkbM family methyltransferase
MISDHVKLIKESRRFNPENVFEIGSRDGIDAVYYAEQFNISKGDVFVFEPNPALYKYIKQRYPDINVSPYAICDFEGAANFNCAVIKGNSSHSDWMVYGISSLLSRPLYSDPECDVKFEEIEVPVKKMSTIIKEYGIQSIDICKVDVEGKTYEVLTSFGSDIRLVKTFHLEMEYICYWDNQVLAPQIKTFLEERGFTLVYEKFIENVMQSDSIWVNNVYL